MPDRTSHPSRGRSRVHADRPLKPRPVPAAREAAARALARNGETLPADVGHGEDAGPSCDGAPPREDRAG